MNAVWGCLILFTAFFGVRCDQTPGTTGPEEDPDIIPTDSNLVPQTSCGQSDSMLKKADADILFRYDSVPVFDIYLPPEEWSKLYENALDEEYVRAEACFEGEGIGVVGLRFKGAYGSLRNCFDSQGHNSCRKLSIKLKLSEYDKKNRFFGLKRLNFQGNRFDDSYIKEKIAYELFQSMDIIAPRASWANIRVNDSLIGLYGMVEQIDGRFTDNRWPEFPDGNLYKEAWPLNNESEWIISHLKTNEDIANIEAFTTFAEDMLSSAPAELRKTLGKYMDLDYWARYMAVDDAIANYDGITAYYTSTDLQGSGNHNFYLYQKSPDKFIIIPWDLESTFTFGIFGNIPHWTETPSECGDTYSAWGDPNSLVLAPGCDRIFQALSSDLESYRNAGKQLLNGPFAEQAMFQAIEDYAAFIRPSAYADPNGPGPQAFEAGVTFLKAQIPKLRAVLERRLEGKSWQPFEIALDNINDFETQDEFSLNIGPQIYHNPNSSVSLLLDTLAPITQTRSLLISFSFANEEKAWDQWLGYIVSLRGGVQDVRNLSGIRLKLKADRKRTLRLELDNTFASNVNGWLREGWDIRVAAEVREVELLFENAAIPDWAISEGLEPITSLENVLSGVKGLNFSPQCAGRNSDGFLSADSLDTGFIEVDDLEFF